MAKQHKNYKTVQARKENTVTIPRAEYNRMLRNSVYLEYVRRLVCDAQFDYVDADELRRAMNMPTYGKAEVRVE